MELFIFIQLIGYFFLLFILYCSSHSTRPTHHRGVSMSAVTSTIMMANTSGGNVNATTQPSSFSPSSTAHDSNSVSTVNGANMSGNQKLLQRLATPESNISGNQSSNSSIHSTSVKSSGSKANVTPVKRKSLSSSRQKKFHRHFPQVSVDEEVINCKFVGDDEKISIRRYSYLTNCCFVHYRFFVCICQ